MGEPQAQSQAPASDPYAAFGGSVFQAPASTAPAAPASAAASATPTAASATPAAASASDPYAAFGGSVYPGTGQTTAAPTSAAQPESGGILDAAGNFLHKVYDYSPMGLVSSTINWTHQKAAETAQGIADNMQRLADAGQLTPARKALLTAAQFEAANLRGVAGVVQGVTSPQAAGLLAASAVPVVGVPLVGTSTLFHGGYNAVRGWGDMIVPDQPGHQTPWYNRIAPDATEAELQALAEAVGGAAMVGEGASAFKARATANAAAKTRAQSIENAENFKKAVPQSAAAPYEVKDYLAAEKYLQHQHASEAITGVPRTVEAADDSLGDIEGHLQKYIQKAPHSLVNADPLAVVRVELGKSMDQTFAAQGIKDLQRFDLNPQNLTLERADKIRWQMNQEMKGILKTNDYDVATARATNPQFAALENASEALREGVYNRLAQPDIGLPEAQSLRADEGSIIKIRNAAQRQIFKGGAVVPNSVNPTFMQTVAAKGAKAAGTGVGALAGGALGSVAGPVGTAGGATAGALIGREAGEIAGRAVKPEPLTKDQMLARIFEETPIAPATPGGPSTPATRAASVGTRTPAARAAATAPPAGTGPTVPPAAAGAPGVTTPPPIGTPAAAAPAPVANPVAAAAATGQPAVIGRVATPAEAAAAETGKGIEITHTGDANGINEVKLKKDGEDAGYLVFNHNGSTASVASTQIFDKENLGKGYGQQMLTEAAKKAKMQGAKAFTSDENGEMTEDAKRPWESLIRKGLPVERITLPNGKPGYSLDLTKIDENAKPIPEEEEAAPEPKPAKPGTAVVGGKTIKAAPGSPAEIAAGSAQRRAAAATTATAAAMMPTQPAPVEKTEEGLQTAPATPFPAATGSQPANRDEIKAIVTRHAQQENLRPGLLEALIQQESRYNPRAISSRGAKGIGQFTDDTAKQYGLDDPYDVEKSAQASSMYMRDLLDRFNGDERKALAAYNWGATHVRNAVHEFGTDWLEHTPDETQHYVRAIEANAPREAVARTAHTPELPHPIRTHTTPEGAAH